MRERREGDPRAGALLGRYLALFAGGGVPVPAAGIAEDLLGLRVREEPGLGASGVLLPAERLILVNGAETPERRRFTIAHELGHWQLHCGDDPPPMLCRAVGPRRVGELREREANVFAAELLMPAEDLRRVAVGASAADLAARFAVSPEAMGWRLFNLGLAEDPPAA